MSEDKSKTIPVMVALRCRPLIKKELDEGCVSCLQTISGEPQVVLGKDRAFTYDYAFGPKDPQFDVYNQSCRKLVDSVFKGYNATILAYGQTGSGKTFTMGGYEASLEGDEDAMGVIPRTLREVFQTMKEKTDSEFSVKVSYMEIYKEDLLDLLCPASQRAPLSIREEGGGIKIQGSREVPVLSYEDTMKLLCDGAHGRTTGATAMNNSSSRSHAIFTLHIDQKNDIGDCSKVKFHMVDLAGSERSKRTMAEGERLKEGININKGLLSLGNVISALGEDGPHKRQHIPYRDSKLTRILQDSLGGNSHTLMIACVSPADSNIEETLNTLRYADRARKIKNKPIINRDPQTAEIMRLKTLVQELQSQLHGGIASSFLKQEIMTTVSSTGTLNATATAEGTRSAGSGHLFPSPLAQSSEELQKLREKVKELEEENHELTKQLQNSVAQSSRTLSQMLKLEASNERLKLRVNQVKGCVGIDLELLSSSIDVESNPRAKAELEKLHKLTGSLDTALPEEEEDADAEEPEEEDSGDKENMKHHEEAREEMTVSTPAKQHAIRQAELHQELGKINQMLSVKQALVDKIEAAEDQMGKMKSQYEEMLQEFKTKTSQLEKENEQLTSNLIDAKSKANASKVAEQRRQRLKDLEKQMGELKKKMAEQGRIVKMKERSDKEMGKLGNEILHLKQQRVQLMRQMKEEVSQFHKWKKEKEKQVAQLQIKERKREVEVAKMKKKFEQEQAVQKRRTAEAMAANKRLLDAMAKHKEVQAERTSKIEKNYSTAIGNRVRQWLSRELEVKVSMMEAQFHLDQLMQDRKQLTQDLNELRTGLERGPLTEKFSWLGDNGDEDDIMRNEKELKKQMTSLQLDIELINAQIQDFQQKIVDADQESKGTSTWQSLHNMNEAKCALKFLLDQAINARAEKMKVDGELRTAQERDRAEEDELKTAKAALSQERQRFNREMGKLQQEYDEKVLFLLKSEGETPGTPCKKTQRIQKDLLKSVESKLKFAEALEEKLSSKDEECERYKQRLIVLRNKIFKHKPDLVSKEDLRKELEGLGILQDKELRYLPDPLEMQEDVKRAGVGLLQDKELRLMPDLEDVDVREHGRKETKMQLSESDTMNSTFLIPSEADVSSNTSTTTAGVKNNKKAVTTSSTEDNNNSDGDSSSSNTTTTSHRTRALRRATRVISRAEPLPEANESGSTENMSVLSSAMNEDSVSDATRSLKRQSGEADTSKDKMKKRKRTLLNPDSNSISYFGGLND